MRFPIRLFTLLSVPIASLSLLGCDTAQLSSAPDAAVNCAAPVLVAGCAPKPAGSPGCGTVLPAVSCFGKVASEAVLDAGLSYPDQCQFIIYDPTPDEDLQCTQLGGCNCYATDAGTFEWFCSPCVDAGQ